MSEPSPAPSSRPAFVVHDLSGRTKGASPWTLRRKIALQLWQYAWPALCAWTPKPLSAWRAFVLKLFGAKITGRVFIHQNARVQQPWNLTMHPRSCLGDGANAYTLGPITIEQGATVGQEAYLCTGTHDFTDHALPLMTAPVVIRANAFIGVRAIIMPGVTVGEEAIVGAGSIVTKDVPPYTIVAGNPARVIRTVAPRRNHELA